MIYHTVIIEDDSMVAAIDRQYVESDKRFRVDRVFKNGVDALEYLGENSADLIILDYYMPVMTGREFLDRYHAQGGCAGVIAVTSAGDADIVQEMVSRGVLDYLVKPFEYFRFQKALEHFVHMRESIGTQSDSLNQETIDRMLHQRGTDDGKSSQLGKGLNVATLKTIRDFFEENGEASFTCEQIAGRVHLSRITVRRYVTYMTETGELVGTVDYQTGGRPSIRYKSLHS